MTAQAAEKLHERTLNGVDVGKLRDTIHAVKEDPEIAKFKFRIKNKWTTGGHNHTTIKDFYGAKEVHQHIEPFDLAEDEPEILLGGDMGPNPVEYLLTGLASCLTTSMVYHAAAKGIEIKGIESRFEGDLDLRGFLGLSEEVPVGYQEIRVYFKIDADISDEKKKELIEMGKKYSPVYNTITHQTPVAVELDSE